MVGKIEPKCQVSNFSFFLAPKSLTAIHTCLDKMESIKGRIIIAFVKNDWLKKKVFKSCVVFFMV